jgi:hypothetical protein
MTKLLLILVLTAFTSTAYAGGGIASLLQCGIKLGGAKPVYETSFGANDRKANSKSLVAVSRELRSVVFPTSSGFTTEKSKSTGRKMPRAITLAKVGCSWR